MLIRSRCEVVGCHGDDHSRLFQVIQCRGFIGVCIGVVNRGINRIVNERKRWYAGGSEGQIVTSDEVARFDTNDTEIAQRAQDLVDDGCSHGVSLFPNTADTALDQCNHQRTEK